MEPLNKFPASGSNSGAGSSGPGGQKPSTGSGHTGPRRPFRRFGKPRPPFGKPPQALPQKPASTESLIAKAVAKNGKKEDIKSLSLKQGFSREEGPKPSHPQSHPQRGGA